MHYKNHKPFIQNAALELGFDLCGFAKAEKLDEDAQRLEKWLSEGKNGKMEYMANHFDLRVDPTLLVPGAKSVITLIQNYYPEKLQNQNSPLIAKYAYGQDYHEVIRDKLKALMFRIREEIGQVEGRGFVDSAPVLERSWALRSGLGWIGKNGNLIHPKKGSFFFIATLITDLTLEADAAITTDHCGTCTRCIDQCPTEAILPNKVLDASKCISYFTIELRDALIPENMNGKFKNWLFGCDICQDVCPWNRFAKPHHEPRLNPTAGLLEMNEKDWLEMTEENFKEIFKDSPIKRTKFQGIKRNLSFIQNPSTDEPISSASGKNA
jgi:epoxyqueuosine reductase